MTTIRDRVTAVAGVLFGAMWLVAAGAKIHVPDGAFRLMARAAPLGTSPKLLLAAAVAAEAALGVAMCLRVVRGFGWSLAGLVAASVVILVVRSQVGGLGPCGCFGSLMGTTLDGALLRLAVLAAFHLALMTVMWRNPQPRSK